MYKRLFPRMAFCLTLITSFLFMPFSSVYADGYNQESEFWRWWYVEHITDKVTEGQGASADNLTDTYNGSSVGQYVYDETGITTDDVKDYVQQQYENSIGYVEHTAEWYSNAVEELWNSSVDAGTKAKYQAEKAIRETVDSAGNVVVNVTSTDYWNNVYNDIFNGGNYKDIYVDNTNNSYNGTVNNTSYSIELAGYTITEPTRYNGDTSELSKVFNLQGLALYSTNGVTLGGGGSNRGPAFILWKLTVNGQTVYANNANANMYYDSFIVQSVILVDNIRYVASLRKNGTTGWVDFESAIGLTGISTNNSQGNTTILQPKQVGYVMHNGIKYPVYNDPSLNPFKINDNGTVTFNDGTGTEPIYVDPSDLTDDGWLNILEWLNNDDNTQNPYNPQGKPWNTQPDGSALGGFFSNLIKDISSIFDGIAKAISNLIDKVIKAIKDISNIIIDALKSFWELLIGDVDEYATLFETDVNDNFGMISDLYDLLLECMGVDA